MHSNAYWDVIYDLCSHCEWQGCLSSSIFLLNNIDIFNFFIFFK